MWTDHPVNVKTNQLFVLIITLVSFFAALILFFTASFGEKKWLVGVLAGLITIFSLLPFIKKLKEIVFLLSIFSLPIKLDVFLYFKETEFIQLKGLPLTLFDILFMFLLVVWIVQILKKQCHFKFYPGLSFPALIAILFSGISVFFSNDRILSFIAFLLFIKSYLLFLYFANNLKEKKTIKSVLWIILISVMFQSLIGFTQYASGDILGLDIIGEMEGSQKNIIVGSSLLSRVGGTIGPPNSLAMFLNIFLPIIFCSLFMRMNIWYKFCAFVTLITGGITEILTLSRGGWVALTSVIFLASYVIFKHKFKSHLKSIVLIAIVTTLIGFMAITASPSIQKRLFEDNYNSLSSRFSMAKIAINMIKENFLFGVGLNSYTSEMEQYDNTRENLTYHFPFPVHNAFLLFAAECGIFALISFLFLLGSVVYKSMIFISSDDRFYSLIGIGFFCGFLSWVIHSQIEPMPLNLNLGLWFSTAMIAAMWDNLNRKNDLYL